MNKPHYKQPITADNIETALQFYYQQNGFKYDMKRPPALMEVAADILTSPDEIRSMYDIEASLDNHLPIVCEVLKRLKIRAEPAMTLRYSLALDFPIWRKAFTKRYYSGKTVLAIERAKGKPFTTTNL